MVKAEVDDREMVHPLAEGAEAYYKYATGDSVSIRLPDRREIALRELRITARRPDWKLFVGSFWFDTESGQLVRAAYRMAVDMDIWEVAGEETKRELEEALAKDTTLAGRRRAQQDADEERLSLPPPPPRRASRCRDIQLVQGAALANRSKRESFVCSPPPPPPWKSDALCFP
jgi:hypothetical protein